jgi:hypothetical protein
MVAVRVGAGRIDAFVDFFDQVACIVCADPAVFVDIAEDRRWIRS